MGHGVLTSHLLVLPVAHLAEESAAEGPDVALPGQEERVRVPRVDLSHPVRRAPVLKSLLLIVHTTYQRELCDGRRR